MEQDNHRSCQESIDFHFKKAKHGKFAVGRIHVNKHKAHRTTKILHTQHCFKTKHFNNQHFNTVYIIRENESYQ